MAPVKRRQTSAHGKRVALVCRPCRRIFKARGQNCSARSARLHCDCKRPVEVTTIYNGFEED